MRPLFFRILGVLLASFVGVLIIAFFLFRWTGTDFESEHEPMQALALVTSGQLVDAHLRGHPGPIVRKLRRHFRARAWILDERNMPVFGPPAPPHLLSRILTYPAFVRTDSEGRRPRFIFGNEIVRENLTYRVIIDSPGPGFRHGPVSVPLGGRIALLLLSLGLASAFLSYWVLRPVKEFVKTTRQLSGERLDARMSKAITSRKDAFGELGKEFNQMTDRLALSLQSQRRLLRDVSHELRSPLARIQVAASLLQQKLGDKSELARIENEVERLDDLIERLLSISRLQNNQGLNADEFKLGGLIQQLVDDANFEFAREKKQASYSSEADIVLVGDRKLISSALENIIRNGLRFTATDQPVAVSLKREKKGGIPGALIIISDNGPGVDPQHMPHLFEPFYQADSSRQVGTGHHGIGLALAHTIVSLHHGILEAENSTNSGLSISMWLPLLPDS